MKLSTLTDSVISPDPDIGSVHYRAQDVRPGGLFVAIPGHTADGHDFADEAIARGALAIVVQKPMKKNIIIIETCNTRKALGNIAAKFYGNPSEKLTVIGVTGTNGKTTITYLIESVLTAAGFKTGVIGTINYRYSGKSFPNPVTTPESLDLQRILFEMTKEGITHVVMEVSSHAIDLCRTESCFFDAAVFTNLTQDHLDYHGNMEAYWICKKRLFTELLFSGPKNEKAFAVINCDDKKGKELSVTLKDRCITTGSSAEYAVYCSDFILGTEGIEALISTPRGAFRIKSNLVGKHNVENILCAAGTASGFGISTEIIKKGIESVLVIPGRLERIISDSGVPVYVDYAHTPDALKNVLLSLRPITRGRLISVFGCGGDRDRTKRPIMGEIATTLSDLAIITSDNPRTEDPEEIISQIAAGISRNNIHRYDTKELTPFFNKQGYAVEPDRKKAIHLSILTAREGDTVLIAGKGHETYQIIGKNTIPFDDREEAKSAVLSADQAKRPFSWSTEEIIEATNGTVVSGDITRSFTGVSIDSRTISPGDLFVAIKGNSYDGHSFAGEVVDKGIKGLIAGRQHIGLLPCGKWEKAGVLCITAEDTVKALGDLAAYNRERAGVSVVAITGSNGKTSTRQMASAIISRRFHVLSTTGNLNNEIGLPLTLLKLSPIHKMAVVELGMNHPGEISRLAGICRPDIGIITNIGPAHLEGVNSIEGVMNAKGELIGGIAPGGTAILNADDERVMGLAQKAERKVILFGHSENALIRALSVSANGTSTSFVLRLPKETITVNLPVPGKFMVSNALAAASAGYLLGLNALDIKAGLENFIPVKGRMNIFTMQNGITIIDDSYNANPGSMEAAIITLAGLKGNRRGILVAGDMLELGTHSQEMHRKIGAICAKSGIARLYASGEFSGQIAEGAVGNGMESSAVFTGTQEDIIDDLKSRLKAEDWVLVKGSRGMKMEKIVLKLKEWAGE
ncbi:MAG: UDP-N-acetylmuramoyl-L-alanyl-D-glutamate--2,6-diaminopimelate ligase [Thermodesulfobacteriota bacterium]|nr:UDP-N-acetylmuramoyl-L-alanyl-D-glutamate--2,6-diaminopimelate ligase [Thermodesulfobacteriota bacterium]